MNDLLELTLLILLWISSAALFLLSQRRWDREREAGDLARGTRLGRDDGDGDLPFDPRDRRSVREAAARHVASLSNTVQHDHRDAQRRIDGLVAQIARNPNDVNSRRQLIATYREKGDTAAAVQQLLVLGEFLYGRGDPGGANQCMRDILDIQPWNEIAQRRLGLRGEAPETAAQW